MILTGLKQLAKHILKLNSNLLAGILQMEYKIIALRLCGTVMQELKKIISVILLRHNLCLLACVRLLLTVGFMCLLAHVCAEGLMCVGEQIFKYTPVDQGCLINSEPNC